MGSPLKVRFQKEGLEPKEIKKAIEVKGRLSVADELGCSLEALTRYAKEELGMKYPQLQNPDLTKSNRELGKILILAMYDIHEEDKNIIKELKAKIEERESEERKSENMVKVKLLEMLQAVKS